MPTDSYMVVNDDLEGTQYERAKQKWEKLTHFMLNIDNIQGDETYSQSLVKLLEESNFVQPIMANHGS